MRQRYYNSQIRRFINQDILTGSIGNSASLNRYSYVEGNPVSYSDPFGLSPFSYISQPLHNTLDWFGMIPVIGVGFDLVNAMVYLMEGTPTYALFEAFSSIGIGDRGFEIRGEKGNYRRHKITYYYVRQMLEQA